MIISRKHKFLYIRNRKVASASTEKYLAQYCSYKDIIINDFKKKKLGLKSHCTYDYIKSNFPEVENYYKFCAERNPWDKVISYYYFKRNKKHNNDPDLKMDNIIRKSMSDFDNYTINGKLVVDKVIQFDTIEEDLREVINKLHLKFNGNFNTFKIHTDTRTDKRHYREILTDEQAEKIAKIFHREIEMFGYKF
jgi:hypothetical protein